MAGSKKQQKFSKLIQKEVSQILQRDYSGDLLGKLITVTDVTMSPDLGLARLYISIFPVSATSEILEFLNHIKPKIRGALGKAIGKDVRIIPELAFFEDKTAETASRMDALIDSLEIPKNDSEAE